MKKSIETPWFYLLYYQRKRQAGRIKTSTKVQEENAAENRIIK